MQALVARKGLPTLFITLTMNAFREEIGRLGFDIENRNARQPVGSKSRVFDWPDMVTRVFNQFANEFIDAMKNDSENYFGRKFVALAGRQEYQKTKIPHQHYLVWLEGEILEEPDEIDKIISAELPNPGEDDELRQLLLKLNKHLCTPYCTRNGK